MSIAQFYIEYSDGYTKTNEVIQKVHSVGGSVYYGGKNKFKIECDRKVKKKLEKEIQDMLKS